MGSSYTGIRQKKSFGQVFLTQDWPCRKLVDLLEDKKIKKAIEIGPGGGILTKALLERKISVSAIEKDDRFAEALEGVCSQAINDDVKLDINNIDVLRFNLGAWIDEQSLRTGVCGNIPYNISSSVMMWVLPNIRKLEKAVFMVQKEFAERVTAKPSTKAYGSLTVFSQLRAKVEFEFHVEREIFSPVPKVDSAVMSFEALDETYSDWDLKKTELLTKTAFSQRRKKMRNSIGKFISEMDESDLGIDLNRRPDSITPLEYLGLSRIIFPENPEES